MTVNNRIKRLKANEIQLGNSPIIAIDKLWYGLTALINIKIRNVKGRRATTKLAATPMYAASMAEAENTASL